MAAYIGIVQRVCCWVEYIILVLSKMGLLLVGFMH
jgi:hypothetical protein